MIKYFSHITHHFTHITFELLHLKRLLVFFMDVIKASMSPTSATVSFFTT